MLAFDMVLDFMAMGPQDVWASLRQSGLLEDSAPCHLDGDTCTVAQVPQRLKRSGSSHFGMSLAATTIHYGHLRNFDRSLLSVRGGFDGAEDAERRFACLLSAESFRQSWVYDVEYDRWQNADDPLEYRAAGRRCDHLPMRSNGLPPPLQQMVIDTAQNPGRRTLRRGYVEAVAAVMWLGHSFWFLSGASKDNICGQDWIRCSELPNAVLRVQVAEKPFASAEGLSGKVQDRLRALLFPR